METVETHELSDGTRLEIMYDEAYDHNPREWDNAVALVCYHGRYNLGDTDATLLNLHGIEKGDSPDELELPDDVVYSTNLYLYDHSGITISCGEGNPFGPWDSGQVGVAVIVASELTKLGLDPETFAVSELARWVEGEVEEYDAYLRGECYRWQITKAMPTCDGCGHTPERDVVESVGGYLGQRGLEAIRADHGVIA